MFKCVANDSRSRTYDDEDQGKVVREGFEPGQLDNASDENTTEADNEYSGSNSKAKGQAEYSNLDDRHVWSSNDGE